MKTQYRILAVIMVVALTAGLTLAINHPASAAFENSPIGYASLNGGTTGGAGGTSVTVTSGAALQSAIDNKGSQPLVINVQGHLTNSTGRIVIKSKSNISIIGVGSGGELDGFGLTIQQSSNIIIRNLKIHHISRDDKDAIQLNGNVHHVWVDHNELYNDLDHDKDYYDGLLDITHGCDYITVSWNVFHTHWKGSLIGHSDDNAAEDQGRFHITYHHNYFYDVNSRTPSNRFGQVHVYNNYMRNIDTGVSSRMGACTRVERNIFENAGEPIMTDQSSQTGSVQLIDNQFTGSGSYATSPTCSLSVPYSYSADAVSQVASIVTAGAGVGKLNQNPPTAVPPTSVPPTSRPTTVPPTGIPPTGAPLPTVSINAGGSATGSFTADQYFSGGSTYTNTATIDMIQIPLSPPPAAIFNTERYGAMTYTIPNRSGAQTVTLYFAETYVTAAGQRRFNVILNGTTVLSSFDIYASAGGANRAIARTFTTLANSSGQVVIQFTAVTQNPKINGITVTVGSPPLTNVPPTNVPPTGVPPTGVPPTGVPPTGVPPTGVPPTSVPPTSGPGACSPVTSTITVPFTQDGAGTFCWRVCTQSSYLNSWNLTSLTVNGVDFTNRWVGSGSYPPAINSCWYISYTGNYPWSHFELR